MRPDDLAASASDGAARTREAASAKAAAPFAAPFHHGALESSPAILSSSEAGRLVFDAGGPEAEARIASARGEARRRARTRRGSKVTPDLTMIPGLANEALVTGEARRVARAEPRTRGRMVTDEDARDIVGGGGTLVWCVPVQSTRGARASLSGQPIDASSSIFERRFRAAGFVGTSIRTTPSLSDARWSHLPARSKPLVRRGRERERRPSLPMRIRTSRTAASTTSATRISWSG